MSEFTDLALEIQRDTGLDFDAAYREAWQQMPDLLDLVMTDVRYIPRRVVMFESLLSAQELKTLTDR
jgi:hypothetical protein